MKKVSLLVACLLWLAAAGIFWGGIAYVAFHFINKFW